MTSSRPPGLETSRTHRPSRRPQLRAPRALVAPAVIIAAITSAAAGATAIAPPDDHARASAFSAGFTGERDGLPLLFNNGPLITCFDCGWGGAGESSIQTAIGLSTVGFVIRQTIGESVAEDFTIPVPFSWTIDSMIFYSCANDTSTVAGLYVRIWDGPPDAGGSVVWGDLTTDRLAASQIINVYRVAASQTGQPLSPIRESVATVGVTLGPGTYWVEWAINSSFPFGPYAPPVTILGQTATGNALGFASGSWAPLVDDGPAAAPQGLPFLVVGSVTGTSGSLYVIDDVDNTLSRVDLLSGSAQVVGSTGIPVSVAGGALDSSSMIAYVSDVELPDSEYGLGWIDLSNGRITVIGSHVSSNNVWALAYDSANDVLWGSDGECPGGPGLSVVDRTTGFSACVGPYGSPDARGLAYAPTTDTLFAIDQVSLRTVDRSTGATTPVGPHGIPGSLGPTALEYAPDLGSLIASAEDGSLYLVDPATGSSTLLHAAVVPHPTATIYLPPGARQTGLGPFAGRLWDNGDTDLAQALSNGMPPGLFVRRTVLDDFEVPAGATWTLQHLRWRHFWNTAPIPAGTSAEIAVRANDPNGGGIGIDGPGVVIADATVRFYAERANGHEAFGRSEATSMAEFDPIELTGGRYWIEWAIIGSDNSFAVANQGAIRDNQCWVDYPDVGGLQPSQTFWGTPYDLTWAIGSERLGVFADGFETGSTFLWSATVP